MCGIFAYTGAGSKNAIEIVLKGLKRLEYRGYDSAGIATVRDGELVFWKEVGKLGALESAIGQVPPTVPLAIGQTRWATHGAPNKINAHPHFDSQFNLALVHNGIIENYETLRSALVKQGVAFQSQTDTEVIAQLIGSFYEGDLLAAVQKTVPLLEGAYAVVAVHKHSPDQIVAFANISPLVIGIGNHETFVSSDTHAFASHTHEAIFLNNSEIALITPNKVEVYNADREVVAKEKQKLDIKSEEATKGEFEHFTLKEIFQQPQTIRSTLSGRLLEDSGSIVFDEANFNASELQNIEKILILACGTSWHAGLIAALMLEDVARIPVRVDISSEFRYKNPIVPPGTYVIAISQSGETADTLAAVREAKAKGARTLAICNMAGSSLVRESDAALFLKAGAEIGVCSTKAFTSQVTVLTLFTLLMARMRHMGKHEGQTFLHALKSLPDQVQQVLDLAPQIEQLAKKYAHYQNFFFIGRRYMFPTSLEGALKLKEIAYINANGYPAGEMKHGPIALLNSECPVVALCANRSTFQKFLGNMMESRARGAPILAIAEQGAHKLTGLADDVIWIPKTLDELAPIPTTVATQLFAYYVARERGADIDHPRNLAKSVTVE